ncbi:enoyl-CoA hydratase-related protein [Luteitalea sp.]|jgi:methylglutaconyl-CoA hydratase|uniref:enoyl-CoA hydratase-related protein n=1 Tax=Luteitalea sp. TaxID=2004800 RepID=UPI000B05C093|nr:enoyl-CoA hydratase-related protein [Luteitalea sp.]
MTGLQVERRGGEVWWTLDRPEVRNALDDALVATLRDEARRVATDASVRVVVLSGAGASFCAGADLGWMRRMRDYDDARNLEDALAVADLFHALASLPMPLVARVHGAALGGGSGLLAVSDLVVARDDTVLGFTEARVGILPATIAPYVIRRIGIAAARTLFLRAHRLSAGEALRLGLVDDVCGADRLDAVLRERLDELALGAASAHRATKALLGALAPLPDAAERRLTAEAIARQRVSEDGQEGLRAFLERRPPSWHATEPGRA